MEAPSTFAASYNSFGIDCSTPVVIAKMNGKPSHDCIKISANRVHNSSVIHGIASIPNILSICVLITPNDSLNIPEKIRIDTNAGTAHGKINIVRKKAFPFKSF